MQGGIIDVFLERPSEIIRNSRIRYGVLITYGRLQAPFGYCGIRSWIEGVWHLRLHIYPQLENGLSLNTAQYLRMYRYRS